MRKRGRPKGLVGENSHWSAKEEKVQKQDISIFKKLPMDRDKGLV